MRYPTNVHKILVHTGSANPALSTIIPTKGPEKDIAKFPVMPIALMVLAVKWRRSESWGAYALYAYKVPHPSVTAKQENIQAACHIWGTWASPEPRQEGSCLSQTGTLIKKEGSRMSRVCDSGWYVAEWLKNLQWRTTELDNQYPTLHLLKGIYF